MRKIKQLKELNMKHKQDRILKKYINFNDLLLDDLEYYVKLNDSYKNEDSDGVYREITILD